MRLLLICFDVGGAYDEQRAAEEVPDFGEEAHQLRAEQGARCAAVHESAFLTYEPEKLADSSCR